jgi:D-alanyl-lipoteichoic acid acyltransferase DltB (MBOAT superfamily)
VLFHSFQYFLVFLPVVALVHAWLRRRGGSAPARAWLLAASLVFYAWARPSFVPLLLGSILFNWAVARVIAARGDSDETARGRKWLLRFGLAGNILFLASFKYVNFAFRTVAALHGPHWQLPDWAFPLGISFFTLTQVMYLVDVYQGLNGANSLFDHALFVSFFPYLASGPLVRARLTVRQFHQVQLRPGRLEVAAKGLYLFSIGLAKKAVLADSFAAIADVGFAAPTHASFVEGWIFAFAFLLQLYFDFSGYSDMAVGSAWMLGIDIPMNFNAPLRARSISEFWQRWHISLSNFITNYLYTPMLRAFPKATLWTSVGCTILAMTIAGFWHGPAWTFGIFGLLHGVALGSNQVWKKRKLTMPDWLGLVLTQCFVAVTMVFFRSADVPAAIALLSRMVPHGDLFGIATLRMVVPMTPTLILRPVAAGVAAAFFFRSSFELANGFVPLFRTAMVTALLVLAAMFFLNSTPAKQFVYFAF